MLSVLRVARTARPHRLAATAVKSTSLRLLSTTKAVASEHAQPPNLYGPGAKDPEGIPSDEEQATGLERYQLLGQMEGLDVFDMKPLDASRLGTVADPIKVRSYYPERLVGCTGSPAESHDVIWLNVHENEIHRCGECGSVYAMDFQGSHEEHHH